jgi:hypothetical protein
MMRMVIVARIGFLVGELHGEAEVIVVLRAHLAKLLEFFDARYLGQHACIDEKFLLGGRSLRVLQPKNSGVANHDGSYRCVEWED